MNRDFQPAPFAVARPGYRPVFHSRDHLGPVRGIAAGTRCWSTGGIIGSDKTQTSTDQQTGASDEARGASASNSLISQDQGNAQGGIGNLNLGTNSFNAAGANLGGVTGTTNTGTITFNGAAGAEAIADKFAETINQINSTASADKLQAQQLIGEALSKVADLSKSEQTGGISALGQLVLWGLGLVIAGLVVWKWNK